MLVPSAMDELRELKMSTSATDRRMVAHDLWPRRLIDRREQEAPTLPARVFWPESTDEVARVVKQARRERRPLVPFGAGSGVCGGISPSDDAWIIDLKRMAKIVDIDEERGTCTAEAGLIGERLERGLNARGLSLGHFPSSIYCSTLGGWLAARSAGQLSSRYGKIEDLVLGFEAVDGRGEVLHARIDDPATGPGALRLLIGNEGSLCIFARITFRVHRLSSHRWLRGFSFEHLEGAVATMRGLLASGEAPSVLRVYDPLDALIAGAMTPMDEPDRIVAGGIARAGLEHSGPTPSADEEPSLFEDVAARVERLALFQRPRAARRVVGELMARPTVANTLLDRWTGACRMVLGVEGSADEVQARCGRLRRRVVELGGTDLGDGPGAKWLLHRHRVSYRMSRAFAAGGWVDSMEVATGWEQVVPLYRAVREALRDVAIVMCHFSHAYTDGCSLYFTFAGGGVTGEGRHSARARYDLAWERALTTVRRLGATLSHHHGVGRSKAGALLREPGAEELLADLKRVLDPDGLLNPGVLGLGRSR
jgi:alkyldihydroxyacetonephosphate synthase